MKCGVRIALGMAGGYLLGRNRKGRMLLLLGAAVASRNLAGVAARRGAASLTSSPEVSKLVEQGREAAVAVFSSRIESLTDQLHSRTEALRRPGGAEQDEYEEDEGPEAAGDEEAEEGHDEPEEEEPEEEEEEEEEDDEDDGPRAEESPGEEPEPEAEAEPEPERRERRRPQGRPARQGATTPRGRATPAGRRTAASQARR